MRFLSLNNANNEEAAETNKTKRGEKSTDKQRKVPVIGYAGWLTDMNFHFTGE